MLPWVISGTYAQILNVCLAQSNPEVLFYLQTVLFQENPYIENYEEKFENDVFPDNSLMIFENLNFVPEEVGF